MIFAFIISVITTLVGNALMDAGMDKHEFGLAAVGCILLMLGTVGVIASVPT